MPTQEQLHQLLLPCDPAGTVWEGFLTPRQASQCPHLWLRVTNVLPAWCGGLNAACLECGPGLQELLKGKEALLAQRCARCPSVEVLLEELQELIDEASCARQAQVPPSLHFYNTLFTELELLGWEKVAELAQDCTALVLQTWDAAGRKHLMHLQLPSAFPEAPPVLSSPLDLPVSLQLRWPPQGLRQHLSQQQQQREQSTGMFREAIRQLDEALHEHQELWRCLEDFDNHVLVLEPALAPQDQQQKPGASERHVGASLRGGGAVCFRRVALGRHCSVEVMLDPLNPRTAVPQVRFLGPSDVVDPLRTKLHSGLEDWDDMRTPRENLEQLLEVTFPGAAEGSRGMANECAAECAICYAYHLKTADDCQGPGDAPEVHCPNTCCGRPFHHRCLLEWLHTLEDTSSSFGMLFGKCPYCSNSIAVKA